MWFEKTKSGKVQFREHYIDPLTGKKKTVSITYNKHTRKNEQEALLMLQKKIQEAMNRVPSAKNMTFKELIDRWLKEYATTCKESTVSSRKSLANQIERRIGDVLLDKLDVSMFNNYLLDLKQRGLKENTVNTHYSTIRLILKFGKSYGFISDNKLLNELIFPKYSTIQSDDDITYLERDELTAIIEQLEDNGYHEIARLCLIQTYTGLRIGELVGIDYERQIDFENNSILIDRTYNGNGKSGKFDLPKTNIIRTIYFNNETKKLLLEQIQYTKIKTMQRGFSKDPLLFKNRIGNPLRYSSVNRILKNNLDMEKKITTHIFRHTFIAYMIEQGTPMELIAKHVGHTNTKTIQKYYYHFTEKMDRDLQKEILRMEL